MKTIELSGGPKHGETRALDDDQFESGVISLIDATGPSGWYRRPETGDGPWTWTAKVRTERDVQDAIQREMAYTTYAESCKDPHITPDADMRECRRAKRHAPPHASGYAKYHVQWWDQA